MSLLDRAVSRLDSYWSAVNRSVGNATAPTRPLDNQAQGWSNYLTGMGFAATDKGASTSYAAPVNLDEREVTEIYRGDGLARRVIDLPAAEALRQGYEVVADDAPLEDWAQWADGLEIGPGERGLDLALERWLVWHRLYGGSALLLLTDSDLTAQPLGERERLAGLRVLSRYDLERADLGMDSDPLGSEPERWVVRGTGRIIHTSRLLLLGRSTLPVGVRPSHGWEDSLYVRLWQALASNGTLDQTATSILHQFVTPVQRINGLRSLLSGNGPTALMQRFGLQQLIRSAHRVTVLDGENESYELQSTSVAGLPELMDRFPERVAAVAGVPLTLLMGRSPAGMNATGESDVRFFYDSVKANLQQRHLRRALRLIGAMAMAAPDGPTRGRTPARWRLEWQPLWQMSDAEVADIRLKDAQRDAIYLDRGVLYPEEVATSRFAGNEGDVALMVERETPDLLADETA